mgnify:CR=1 FL=1
MRNRLDRPADHKPDRQPQRAFEVAQQVAALRELRLFPGLELRALQLFDLAAEAFGQQFFFIFISRERVTLLAQCLVCPILLTVACKLRLQLAESIQIAQVLPLVKQVLPVVLAMDIEQQRASVRSCAVVTGTPQTRQDVLPSAVIWRRMMSSSSHSISFSSHQSRHGSGSNVAQTTAFSAPVRTSSREARAPRIACMASTRMDLPAPVSPVRMFRPGRAPNPPAR